MSAVDLLLGLLLTIGCLMFIGLPWFVVISSWYCYYKHNDYNPDTGILVLLCIMACIFEVTTLIDWFFGHTSKFFVGI